LEGDGWLCATLRGLTERLAIPPPLIYGDEALILVRINRIVLPVTSDRPIHQRQYSHHPHNRPRPRDGAWAVGRQHRWYAQQTNNEETPYDGNDFGDCQLNIRPSSLASLETGEEDGHEVGDVERDRRERAQCVPSAGREDGEEQKDEGRCGYQQDRAKWDLVFGVNLVVPKLGGAHAWQYWRQWLDYVPV
jgi:hypothetical protein